MDFLSLCKNRYSVRDFSEKPISDEDLAKILEAGRLSPTALNLQPQRVYVMKTPEILEKTRELTGRKLMAPVALLIAYDATKSCKYERFGESGFEGGEIDAAIVTTMMMMEAESLGIGSLWTRGWKMTTVREAYGLPETVVPTCILYLGYPGENCKPSERHEQRLPLDETVFSLE